MTNSAPQTILCITSYEKGQEFLRECKRQGWRVILLSVSALEHANWPRESIDELFFMPDLANIQDVIHGVSYLARTRVIDRIVALDDYDVWTGAALREHFRLPGMGDSQVRLFRDKLAMRVAARQQNIPVPDFVPILNYDAIREFMSHIPAPWVLKPRAEATTIGIAKISSADELWPRLDELADRQSFYLLERFIPGNVYHIDSLVFGRKAVFAEVHQYGRPPLNVFHEGGVSTTRTVPRTSKDARALKKLNQQMLKAFGMTRGVMHTEFIKAHENGNFYFIETAARVGGASISDLVEHATGINLWREWAKIETTPDDATYQLPEHSEKYAGVIISLARQEHPDTSAYQDPEIAQRLDRRHHAGLVVASHNVERVQILLEDYARRFTADFSASLPPLESKPPSTLP